MKFLNSQTRLQYENIKKRIFSNIGESYSSKRTNIPKPTCWIWSAYAGPIGRPDRPVLYITRNKLIQWLEDDTNEYVVVIAKSIFY